MFSEAQGKYSESTRERILAAATELFAKNGFIATSIRHITESATVNVAAVNYHFGSKENLYREVIRQRAQACHKLRAKVVADAVSGISDPAKALEMGLCAFVSQHLSSMIDDETSGNDLNLFFREISSPGLGFEVVLQELILPTRKILVTLIRGAHPGINEEEASFCISSLMGQMIHFARAKKLVTISTGKNYDSEMVDNISRHIVAFTIGGIAAIGGAR